MTDYDILKYLGLEIKDGGLVFYDDDSNEYNLEFSEIKDITLESAYIPLERKLAFWMEKLLVKRSFMGILDNRSYNEDYRTVYELEIELTGHRVLSRKVRDADIVECKEVISEINRLTLPYNSSVN
ncbi:MAG: hypothetical protein MI866_24120 [Bacteroidales bacterium]|nr:hypothetical protein [Bacteroidales bacterium]